MENAVHHSPLAWILFIVFILIMLALDLGVFNRHTHEIKMREALRWVVFCMLLAFAFNALIYFWLGADAALAFTTAYIVEQSLSVDNIFVIVMIFSYFRIPAQYQHRVLFWGILGALIMRGIFIAAGIAMIQKFEWLVYVFGAILVFSGLKLLFQKEGEDPDLLNSKTIRLTKKIFPVSDKMAGSHFFTKINGKKMATPLFLTLIVIEVSDLIFAVDSIPAIISISRDTFIVYTSNIFAILCLRSLYFAIAGLVDIFHYLRFGLSAILTFVGIKMLLSHYYPISVITSLGIIIVILALCVLASLIWPKKEEIAEAAKSDFMRTEGDL
jgi:tellurite resistance protein TerC